MRNNETLTWRDNKTVLWLVRIGFILQFYIPAIICGYIIWTSSTPVQLPAVDDPYYSDYEFGAFIRQQFFLYGILTLILLVAQCTLFTLILRYAKLRSAVGVLVFLIGMNVIHSMAWMFFMLPVTLVRLALPTLLYFIACCADGGTPMTAGNEAQRSDRIRPAE